MTTIRELPAPPPAPAKPIRGRAAFVKAVKDAYAKIGYSFYTYHTVGAAKDTLEGVAAEMLAGYRNADFLAALDVIANSGFDVAKLSANVPALKPPTFPKLKRGLVVNGASMPEKRVLPLTGEVLPRYKKGDKLPALSLKLYRELITAPLAPHSANYQHNTYTLGFKNGIIDYAFIMEPSSGCENASGFSREEINRVFDHFRKERRAFCGLARVGADHTRRFMAGYGKHHIGAIEAPYLVLSLNLDGAFMSRYDGRRMVAVTSFRMVA